MENGIKSRIQTNWSRRSSIFALLDMAETTPFQDAHLGAVPSGLLEMHGSWALSQSGFEVDIDDSGYMGRESHRESVEE